MMIRDKPAAISSFVIMILLMRPFPSLNGCTSTRRKWTTRARENGSVIERRIFNILRQWRGKQEMTGKMELEMLCRSLRETDNTEALKLLEQFLEVEETESA